MSTPLRYRKNRAQPQPTVQPLGNAYAASPYKDPLSYANVQYPIQYPGAQQYTHPSVHPGAQQYAQSGLQSGAHPSTQSNAQYPSAQYPNAQYSNAQYPGTQYTSTQYTSTQYPSSQQPSAHFAGTPARYHQHPAYKQAQQYAQQYAQEYAQQYAQYQQQQEFQQQIKQQAAAVQQLRKPREYNRADRLGRIVDSEKKLGPNQESIEKLIAATRRSNESVSLTHDHDRSDLKPNTNIKRYRTPVLSNGRVSVTIKLPTRQVSKIVSEQTTASELAAQLVREHRLEFEFEDSEDNENLILWECIDGTRRPLRDHEPLAPVVLRWGNRLERCYIRTTPTGLRNDVDSLASLVPRRDMLRSPPTLMGVDVRFSRPSVMYNPHAEAETSSTPSPPSKELKGSGNGGSTGGSGAKLNRVPSKLNPSDECLSSTARSNPEEHDDNALGKQLVWGFGVIDLQGGRITLKQKPGDDLISSMSTGDIDVYEWPHPGPKKYAFVIRSQQNTHHAIYISVDSAKAFSVLRNAIYTARTKVLLNRR